MDEAGLGPNLGPFVIAVTVWEVAGDPREFDFWQTFSHVLTNAPVANDRRLHIADSKQVFQPHRGFGGLERGVFSALQLCGHRPATFAQFLQVLSPTSAIDECESSRECYHEANFSLPTESHDDSIVQQWHDCCERHGVRLQAVKAAVVHPRRFNQLLREYDNKSLVVSRLALRLLRSVWTPDECQTFIVGDKHGGRNRYDQLLAEVLDGEMIFRLEEGAERSDYRVGKSLLRFQPRAEEHGPVALASMTAKYVRELAMNQFNRFWAGHCPEIKPTQGYPLDAKRFYAEIRDAQQSLGIPDDELWRNR